jgi:hypothetical protein
MRIMTIPDGQTWLRERGLPEERSELEMHGLSLAETYRIPSDCGRKTALARLITGVVRESSASTVVRITGYGIWSSSENPKLFEAVRRGWGERRPLRISPFHAFESGDSEQLECLLDLVLYFSWDALLVTCEPRTALWFSHDEMLDLHAGDPALHLEFKERFGHFALEMPK